jgi:hypothetical protein
MGQSAGSAHTPGAEKTRLSVSIVQPGLAQQHPDTQSSTDSQARRLTSFGSHKPRKQSRVEMQSADVAHGTSPPQTFGVPSPPQVAGAVQLPQVTVPPQPSGTEPQLSPAGHAVVGVQPQTFAVPPPPQVLGDPQDPQSSMSGQVPSEIMPQLAPCAAQVVGVQHVPNELVSLTQTPVQQLCVVRQDWPSGLQGLAPTASGRVMNAISIARRRAGVRQKNLNVTGRRVIGESSTRGGVCLVRAMLL